MLVQLVGFTVLNRTGERPIMTIIALVSLKSCQHSGRLMTSGLGRLPEVSSAVSAECQHYGTNVQF
jgi:hypothetical protein